MKILISSIRVLLVMTVLTGIAYPFVLLAVGRIFPYQAGGSLLRRDGTVVGSALIAQNAHSGKYFEPRPSAGDFATVPSGASNLGPTSVALAKAIQERKARWGADAPADLLTASASGIDPHLTPEAVAWQVRRVAEARGIPVEAVEALVKNFTERPQFGFLGEPRVRILELNMALDDYHHP